MDPWPSGRCVDGEPLRRRSSPRTSRPRPSPTCAGGRLHAGRAGWLGRRVLVGCSSSAAPRGPAARLQTAPAVSAAARGPAVAPEQVAAGGPAQGWPRATQRKAHSSRSSSTATVSRPSAATNPGEAKGVGALEVARLALRGAGREGEGAPLQPGPAGHRGCRHELARRGGGSGVGADARPQRSLPGGSRRVGAAPSSLLALPLP